MIYVIAFDPIKILTCWALQNDRQNLSFVKATNVVGKKMAGNTCKMAISYLCHFRFETDFSSESNKFLICLALEFMVLKFLFVFMDTVKEYVS